MPPRDSRDPDNPSGNFIDKVMPTLPRAPSLSEKDRQWIVDKLISRVPTNLPKG